MVVIACIFLPALWAYSIRQGLHESMTMPDFSGIYYGARCVLHQRDPYDPNAYLEELREDDPDYQKSLVSVLNRWKVAPDLVYPPTALLVAAPLAVLPRNAAENVFMILTAGSLALAGFLIWDLAGERGRALCGYFVGYLMADCLILLLVGNVAGIAISFCIVAAWCFLEEHFETAGVVLLALSLSIKPHDSGFVWLYFLLAGGVLRKRALQALSVAGALGICAALWLMPTSPHWFQELSSNVAIVEVPGGTSDPGPTGLSYKTQMSPIISLQAAISIFKNEPHFYNLASWLIVGSLVFIWAVTVLRKRCTRDGTLLATAAISALTLLPVYHRPHDAKLLLLMVPACGMLWASNDARKWIGFGLSSAAIFFSSDWASFIGRAAGKMKPVAATPGGKLEALLLHPAPVMLLAAGCFYLWLYIRYEPTAAVGEVVEAVERATEAAAT